jgi:hypothetical protein
MKGKSSTGKNQTTGKRGQRDAFHEDIHVLELKEASERRAQKNIIRLKELELQEKRHAAKVRKMEMDAEIQKAQLAMLSNMATMFASGSSRTGGVGGIHVMSPVLSWCCAPTYASPISPPSLSVPTGPLYCLYWTNFGRCCDLDA